MANRGDVVSVDKLWDVFGREREKAWEGVEAPVGRTIKFSAGRCWMMN